MPCNSWSGCKPLSPGRTLGRDRHVRLPLAAVARPDLAPAALVRSEGVTHPLRDLAALGTRERVRAAVGVCVDFDPDEHAERIVAEVLRVRVPEFVQDVSDEQAAEEVA